MARGIILPIQIPVTLPSAGVIVLPIRLPITFTDIAGREFIKVTTTEICQYPTERQNIKIPTVLQSSNKIIKIPTQETGWHFVGIIISENVVDKMSKPLTVMEEVRSRILLDVEMTDRNHINLKWYGDKVPTLDVLIKSFVDDKYEVHSTHNWGDSATVIQVGEQDYQIMALGKNGTGESSVIELNASDYIDVLTDVRISINEKIYDINIDLTSEYSIEVNL